VKESLRPEFKTMLLDVLEKNIPTAKIYLYDSRARQTHQEGADIDIALDNGTKIALDMVVSHNLTIHIYREEMAKEISKKFHYITT
jgi:predicted nucleotidyltransferase